jgi:NAD(P)-dependent dehydrogenase (short-subunit alcohol dehydrogenase family)
MIAAGKGGRIISLGGDSSRIGEAGLALAAAARAGMNGLTKSLACEFGRGDIRLMPSRLGWCRPRTRRRSCGKRTCRKSYATIR